MGYLAPGEKFDNMLQLKCFNVYFEGVLNTNNGYFHIVYCIVLYCTALHCTAGSPNLAKFRGGVAEGQPRFQIWGGG